MSRSVEGYLNNLRASWKTRFDVNSTIKQLVQKIDVLCKSRRKELKTAYSTEDKNKVMNRYDNDIKFYDYVLYYIKLNYYEIIGNL